MKILVYGCNGWIGQQMIRMLEEQNINFYCGKCKVNNKNELIREIDNVQPSHVISFIGRTHGIIDNKTYTTIDYLEQKIK